MCDAPPPRPPEPLPMPPRLAIVPDAAVARPPPIPSDATPADPPVANVAIPVATALAPAKTPFVILLVFIPVFPKGIAKAQLPDAVPMIRPDVEPLYSTEISPLVIFTQ